MTLCGPTVSVPQNCVSPFRFTRHPNLPILSPTMTKPNAPTNLDLDKAAQEVSLLTPVRRRVIDAAVDIMEQPPHQTDFLHSVLCQVGMPRRRVQERTFERTSGNSSIKLEAGELWNGREWVEQSLPYGPCPRLVVVHISSEAVKTKSRYISIGESTNAFLQMLGVPSTGGKRGGYTTFRKQMSALAACRLTLGYVEGGRAVTIKANPIERFEAWIQHEGYQKVMWPGALELSPRFYDTLVEHAVPLDTRALGALKHSALALDIYTWLAHRLCRIPSRQGVFLNWGNLQEQFGQEYPDWRNFKRNFLHELKQVCVTYPAAKLEPVRGGLMLKASPPPIPKTQVLMPGKKD